MDNKTAMQQTLDWVDRMIAEKNTQKIRLTLLRGTLAEKLEDEKKQMSEYARQESIRFLNSIRAYEHESGNRICFDERTSEELYDQFQ